MFFTSFEECNELSTKAVQNRNFALCSVLNDLYEDLVSGFANCYYVKNEGKYYIYIPKRSRCVFRTRKKARDFASLIKFNKPSDKLSLKPNLDVYLFKHMRKATLIHEIEPTNDHAYWHIQYNDLCYQDVKIPVKNEEVIIFPDYEVDV